MKITSVEIYDCEINRKDPTLVLFNPVIIRVNTDEGISGIGEIGLAYGNASKAAVGIVKDLARLVIGKDPTKVEYLWDSLFRNTFWGLGGGPVIYGGISAFDIAFWDIRGKLFKAPVHELLGGKIKSSLRTYASQLQYGWDHQYKALSKPEDYAFTAEKAVAEGYDSFKVDPIILDKNGNRPAASPDAWKLTGILTNDQLNLAVNRIAAMREAVGEKIDIIVEIHSVLGLNAAIQLGKALEPYHIFYYEEAVNPLNADNMALLARSVNIPIASGERIYTRWGYRPFLEKQVLAVIQPDICLAGGFTECKKICDYASIYDSSVQLHACGAPVTTAAALQLEAAIPNFIIHEHHTYALKPALRELCIYDYQPLDGHFPVPDLPGIGQELNDEVMKEYLAFTIK
ncbi:mandelate racemase/muconate lactonizing enzyme family protein [Oxalobacter aliiformigenes]|uniref:mandelate racemase/muconate lactonizing enzyme family protein n=1 Tax=Oxalobacter aliiformigenes TaxID=2946593 RepID=UPI0022B075C4|nr:mandelate racemase/muconate lactonizing enzyme family protein [Oxalobacter aliiformigenes]MCZ4065764.1 mandelate racemase/muconate lactonizing enzyme family protein [Oxalobacter aliiformigenes]WAV99870.1 mandelate racemase/muconate lactonizing enzyme family protein [Oxalobacter aliiformigenes]